MTSYVEYKTKTMLIDTGNRFVVTRGRGWGVCEMGQGNQKIQLSRNKSGGCNVDYEDCS